MPNKINKLPVISNKKKEVLQSKKVDTGYKAIGDVTTKISNKVLSPFILKTLKKKQ